MKILSKKVALIAVGVLLLSSCQKGLVYDDVPESVYNEVGLKGIESNLYVETSGRRIFTKNIRQVNFMGQPLVDAILLSNLSLNTVEYTNNTGSAMTISEATVQPGDKYKVANYIEEVPDANAPEGTLYVVHAYVNGTTTYKSPNNGNLFDLSTFGEDGHLSFLDEEIATGHPGLYNKVTYPTDLKQLVVALILQDDACCYAYPQDNAPELGKPGDFSVPRRYLVVNENNRPDGSGQRKRLYEVKIEVLP